MEQTLSSKALHERYDWLDQARGLVVLLLLVSMPTAEYAGDFLTGDPFLGPPMLNHGYEYFDGYPQVITFIDVGQALFLFVLGFVGYVALTSRWRKRGGRSAFWYAARRVGILYALSFVDAILLQYLSSDTPHWDDFIYNGTFALIAIGSFAAFLSIAICHDADRRFAIAIGLIMLHALIYEFPIFDERGTFDNVLGLPRFPFGALGLASMAIAGTCFGQWHRLDADDPLVGFRKRIVPVSTAAFIAAYCVDWIQPAQHHAANAALQLIALYMGGFMLMIFFAFGQVGFRFPLLTSLGRNLLLIFAVGGLFNSIYLSLIPKTFLMQSPYLALLLGGIVPVALFAWFAVFLDKRGIMVRA
ncbi:MAG: hypothetical protein AMXMBFR82_02450 [Candidatus Hydrogenedentota bacterium]